jgi:hypothetical protein
MRRILISHLLAYVLLSGVFLLVSEPLLNALMPGFHQVGMWLTVVQLGLAGLLVLCLISLVIFWRKHHVAGWRVQQMMELPKMELFPSKNYSVRLRANDAAVWERLRSLTEPRDFLGSVPTKKHFIGRVKPNAFKVISSQLGRGAFCTVEGHFTDGMHEGKIRVEINKPFRLLMVIFLLMSIGALVFIFLTRPPLAGLRQALMLALLLLFARFVVVELTFRMLSGNCMTGLKKVLEVIEINEVED